MKQIEIIESLVNQFGDQCDRDALDQIKAKVENMVDWAIDRITRNKISTTGWERNLIEDLKELKEFFNTGRDY